MHVHSGCQWGHTLVLLPEIHSATQKGTSCNAVRIVAASMCLHYCPVFLCLIASGHPSYSSNKQERESTAIRDKAPLSISSGSSLSCCRPSSLCTSNACTAQRRMRSFPSGTAQPQQAAEVKYVSLTGMFQTVHPCGALQLALYESRECTFNGNQY